MMFLITLYKLFGFPIGIALTISVGWYFLRHPNKLEKWASMIGWVISCFWHKAEYFTIKAEIQGKINSFVGRLESNTTAKFPRVSIKWVAKGPSEIIWEEGEVIIVMRDRKHRTKNFVHAAYFFTSEALLKKSKRHLSKTQKTSLDLFATKKILESENKASVEQFMDDYFVPQLEKNDAIRELIKQHVHIDRIGVFFPILIQELTCLGSKVFLSKPTAEVIEEVKALIDFLERFSQREVGDISVQDTFIGKYTRCAIRIIASRSARESGDITSDKERVVDVVKRDFENIYIIGGYGRKNRNFIDAVVKAVLDEYDYLQLVKPYHFKGQIKIRGKLTDVDTYLVHLRHSKAAKYLYEQNDIESIIH